MAYEGPLLGVVLRREPPKSCSPPLNSTKSLTITEFYEESQVPSPKALNPKQPNP